MVISNGRNDTTETTGVKWNPISEDDLNQRLMIIYGMDYREEVANKLIYLRHRQIVISID